MGGGLMATRTATTFVRIGNMEDNAQKPQFAAICYEIQKQSLYRKSTEGYRFGGVARRSPSQIEWPKLKLLANLQGN